MAASQTNGFRPAGDITGTPVDPLSAGGTLIDLATEIAGILGEAGVDSALARDTEVPGLVPAATETVQGKIEIATQAETDAGIDDTKSLTPAKLANAPGFPAPIADTVALVKGSADPTKQVRIEADGLTAATTRTISMPDKDVTLDDVVDARPPTAHASEHTDGTDDIQDATAAQKGLATTAQIIKLDGIEAGATVDQTAGEIEAIASHDNLQGVAVGEHRVINDAGTSTTELWSASKIDSEVPTVVSESFAATNARFFGELGLPAAQGWIDTPTGSATIDLVTENVLGTVKQVIRHNDDVTNGSTTSKFDLTAQNWTDINAFGASYSGTSRLDTSNGSGGFFSGLQANAAENPLATGNRRYGITFNDNGGNLRVSEPGAGGTTVTFDGTGGNPLIRFDEWVSWECVVPSGLGAAQFYINGILTTFAPTFITNTGGLGTHVLVSSGSTSGVNRITFHDNFGVTVYEQSATKTLAVATMAADKAQVFIPEGRRDYTIILPDGNPRPVGTQLEILASNVLGTVKLVNQVPATPEILYNGLRTLQFSVVAKETFVGINTVDNDNVYVGFLAEQSINEPVTGLLKGGKLSINSGDSTKFDIATGIGRILDETDPTAPVLDDVPIAARSAITDLFPGSALTYVLLDSSDNIVQQSTAPTPLQRRTNIVLGRFSKGGGVITAVVSNPATGYGLGKTLEDVLSILGGIGTGSEISANADLTLDITAGDAVSLGRGFTADKRLPNTIALPAQTPIPAGKFFKVFEDGAGALVLDTATNTLDPDQFNDGGTLASVTPLGYTIQRAFIFPETNILAIYYGNTIFATLNSAINHRQAENWEEHDDSMPGVLRAWIFVQEGVVDLAAAIAADPPRAVIVTAGVIRPPIAKGIDFIPKAILGQFSDSTTQKPSVTTPVVVTFDSDDTNSGIGRSRPEDFKILTAGFYSFVFQPQTERTGSGGIVLFHAWPRVGRRDGEITAVAFGSPTTITAPDHRIQTGQTVTLAGLSTTPDINGAHVVTVVDADTFTITTATSAVTDGVGTWTRQLDVSDDVPKTNIELALTTVSQSDVIPLFLNKQFKEEDVVQMMQSVTDATKGAGLAAKTPAGEPAIPSVILSVNKVGDQ